MKALHFLATSLTQTYPRRRLQTSPGGSGQVRSTAKLRISLQILNRIENLSILTPFGSVSGRGGQSSPPSDRTSLPIRPFLTIAMYAALANCAPSPPTQTNLATAAMIDAAERAPLDPFTKANAWNEPMEPFTVIANVHYVGTKTVSAWLITSPKGHFLIDAVVAQSAPQIAANIETLGYKIRDVKFLLNSHAHFDHAGGLAGLKQRSGATMVASAADKPYLEAGDIGHGPSGGMKFPPVRVDRIIGDGERLSLGGVTLTAHLTPGHSPGCTSWSMDATGADKQNRHILFHCSSTVAGQSLVPEAYPGMVANFRATFAKVRKLKADIFLANHDNFFDLHAKRARQKAGEANAFVDPGELARFNEMLERAFEGDLAKQRLKEAVQ
jgi:metallo-beta-lactamase class B